jgi:hypothetical protein
MTYVTLNIVASATRGEISVATIFVEAGRSVTSGQGRSGIKAQLATILKIT